MKLSDIELSDDEVRALRFFLQTQLSLLKHVELGGKLNEKT